jgi:hypothetical protein
MGKVFQRIFTTITIDTTNNFVIFAQNNNEIMLTAEEFEQFLLELSELKGELNALEKRQESENNQ